MTDPISPATAEAVCTAEAMRSAIDLCAKVPAVAPAPLTCRQALAELLREVAASRDYPCDALRRAINAGYRALGEVQP